MESQVALKSLSNASQGLQDATNNPAIGESLGNLEKATAEADTALANLDAISASGNRDAQMVESRLREALKPASLAKSIIYHALGIAAPAAQIASAVK